MKLRALAALFLLGFVTPSFAADIYANQAPSASVVSPAVNGAAITPTDNAPLAQPTRMIYVGGAGNLTVILTGMTTTITFTAVPAGTVLNIRASDVQATGTTATSILGLW